MCQTGQCLQCQVAYQSQFNQAQMANQITVQCGSLQTNHNYQQVYAAQQVLGNQLQIQAGNVGVWVGGNNIGYASTLMQWAPVIALLEEADIKLDTPEKVEEMKEMMNRLIKMKAFW
jgi:hypothetical protein